MESDGRTKSRGKLRIPRILAVSIMACSPVVQPDGGMSDASMADAGMPDASMPDASIADSGMTCLPVPRDGGGFNCPCCNPACSDDAGTFCLDMPGEDGGGGVCGCEAV